LSVKQLCILQKIIQKAFALNTLRVLLIHHIKHVFHFLMFDQCQNSLRNGIFWKLIDSG